MKIIDYAQRLSSAMNRQMGVACGSTMTSIVVLGRGVVVREPTALIVNRPEQKVVMTGADAIELEGKIASPLEIIFPVSQGVFTDDEEGERLMKMFFQKALGRAFLFKPVVMASIPAHASEIDRSTARDVFSRAGAREVYLIDESLAAAIGAGIPVAQSGGNMCVHIGGEHTEATVVSLGSSVLQKTIALGGRSIDQAIVDHVKKKYGLDISVSVAQEMKESSCSARLKRLPKHVTVRGRDLKSGMPKELSVPSTEILALGRGFIADIVTFLKEMLEEIPASLMSDVIDKGCMLTGGGALFAGLDKVLTQELDIPISMAEHPEMAVIDGIAIALEHLPLYKQSLLFK